MKPQNILFFSCFIVLYTLIPNATPQGTAKVQEFFKKYFGEYFPKTTRSYTLYGNGLNGPADFNAGLPVAEDLQEGPVQNIIIRRGSPSRKNNSPSQPSAPGGQQAPGPQHASGGQQLPGAPQLSGPHQLAGSRQQSPGVHQLPIPPQSAMTNQALGVQQLSLSHPLPAHPAAPAPIGPNQDNSWQPTSFDPVAFSKGGHRGRSDLTSEFDDEPEIITAEDAQQIVGAADSLREFRMESSMSFNPGF